MKKTLLLTVASMLALLIVGCNSDSKKDTTETDTETVAQVEVTADNLRNAIIGETTASAKYAAYAAKADEEGFPEVANLFRATSKAESIHADNHRKVLTDMGETMEDFTPDFSVGTTEENLKDAINGETEEFTNMYPEYIESAKAESNDAAVRSFTFACDTEKAHEQLYQGALDAVAAKKDLAAADYYVCPVCGNTYSSDNVKDACGLCMTPKERFIVVK